MPGGRVTIAILTCRKRSIQSVLTLWLVVSATFYAAWSRRSTLRDQSFLNAWLDVRVGTDDLPDAYRGHPVAAEHLRFSIVSLWVQGQGWRFSLLWGLAYGLESAVVSFNRLPLLGIAACRRMASDIFSG